jgi:hypothetical protein
MPSFEHEGFVRLFRNRPELAAELLRDVLGVALPAYTEARIESAELTDIEPAARYADLVVLLVEGKPVFGIVVEVQLDEDKDKPFTWPVYVANLRARIRCPVDLLVVTPDPKVARWASRRIELGHRSSLEPFVVGPDGVPAITDPTVAARDPELAVLSAMAHGQGAVDEAIRVALAALHAASTYADDRALLYSDLVLAALSGAARTALEELMTQGYEYQSDFAKRHRAQGAAEARARDVVTFLEARGLAISAAQRERILACTDLDELDRWVRKAATVTNTEALFAD